MSNSLPDPRQSPLQNQAQVQGYKKYLLFSLVGASFILNAFLIISHFSSIKASVSRQASQYPLISKRVFVDNPNDILVNFVELRSNLRQYVESRPHRLGLYFEYLPSGVSIGLNEKDNFVQASLLKVPIVMAVYHKIEQGQLSPQQKITIQEDQLDAGFGTLWQKGPGYQITVEEAVSLVLQESDNTAKNALLSTISMEELSQVFDYLDIPKESEEAGPVVSPKNYSSILRSLYLASFLPIDHSNLILDEMTHSVHTDRLAAGLPGDVKMAHKIGVYSTPDSPEPEIYTDCGIIYAPLRPYILCVMVEADKATATSDMKTLSHMVYSFVSQAN